MAVTADERDDAGRSGISLGRKLIVSVSRSANGVEGIGTLHKGYAEHLIRVAEGLQRAALIPLKNIHLHGVTDGGVVPAAFCFHLQGSVGSHHLYIILAARDHR